MIIVQKQTNFSIFDGHSGMSGGRWPRM